MHLSRIIKFIAAAILFISVGSCTSMRTSMLGVLGKVPAPSHVAGLSYAQIDQLGVDDEQCQTLQSAFQQNQFLPRDALHDALLPSCEHAIARAQAREQWLVMMDAQIDQAWRDMLKQKQVNAAKAAARKRVREGIRERQNAAQQEQQDEQRDKLAVLRQQISQAHIHASLVDVPDKPLGYTLADISERSMKEFIACIELAYPNQGYEVTRSRHQLTVRALKSELLRGDVTIEARFHQTPDIWVLNYLRVAEIEAPTAQDRFILAQNLMASRCYAVDGLL